MGFPNQSTELCPVDKPKAAVVPPPTPPIVLAAPITEGPVDIGPTVAPGKSQSDKNASGLMFPLLSRQAIDISEAGAKT